MMPVRKSCRASAAETGSPYVPANCTANDASGHSSLRRFVSLALLGSGYRDQS